MESSGTTLRTYIQINWKNLDEMDKFLDTYDQLNKANINHLDISITHNEIEAAIKSLPKKEKSRT
jgi:hypothetical protein